MNTTLRMIKALADGSRLRVVVSLMEHEELCVCQLTELLGLATATVSRHMSILQASGLTGSRKEGRWVFYRLSDGFPRLIRQWLDESLKDTAEIKADAEKLKRVLSCDLEVLCRQQKERFKH